MPGFAPARYFLGNPTLNNEVGNVCRQSRADKHAKVACLSLDMPVASACKALVRLA